MPANSNVYPVYVTVANVGNQPAISIAPPTLSIAPADRNIAIVFTVVDLTANGGAANWRFPTGRSSGNGDDEYYGITIQGDTGQQFSAAQRDASGLFVTVTDNNTNSTSYTYNVQLTNAAGATLGIDPTIKNQGGN